MVRTAHFRSHEVFRGDLILQVQYIIECSGWIIFMQYADFVRTVLTEFLNSVKI